MVPPDLLDGSVTVLMDSYLGEEVGVRLGVCLRRGLGGVLG